MDTASVANQYAQYPRTVRISGVQTEVFDLSKPDQLAGYNALNAKSTVKDPSIAVIKDLPQFVEKTGSWTVFFQYRKFSFLKLTPDKTETK